MNQVIWLFILGTVLGAHVFANNPDETPVWDENIERLDPKEKNLKKRLQEATSEEEKALIQMQLRQCRLDRQIESIRQKILASDEEAAEQLQATLEKRLIARESLSFEWIITQVNSDDCEDLASTLDHARNLLTVFAYADAVKAEHKHILDHLETIFKEKCTHPYSAMNRRRRGTREKPSQYAYLSFGCIAGIFAAKDPVLPGLVKF